MPAKSNRWQRDRYCDGDFLRLGRGKDELHMLRRLFQRFQQGVERLLGEHVHFVDDVNLVPHTTRPHRDVLSQLTYLVDPAVTRAVDLQHIHVIASGHAQTHVTLVARRGCRALHAIKRLGQDAGRGSFSHAASTREKIRMPHAIAGNRLLQRLGHMLLADQLLKTLRPIPPGNDDVAAGGLIMGRCWRRRVAHREKGVRCRVPGVRSVILTPEYLTPDT